MTMVPRLHKETSIFGSDSIAGGLERTAGNAVKRTQRIYHRKATIGAPAAPGNAQSDWVTAGSDGSHRFGEWTVKVPRLTANADGTGAKYLYLYTCEQREMGDGTLAYTPVLLDDTATIIDGGTIITGSVAANTIDAASGTFSTANIPELTTAHIKANVIDAVNGGEGTISAGKINASALSIGYSQLTDPPDIPTALGALENDSGFITASDASRNFTAQPEPPYSVGDMWTPVGSGATKVCIAAKGKDEAYSDADWQDADGTVSALSGLRGDIDNLDASVSQDMANLESRLSGNIANADQWRNYLRATPEVGLVIGQEGDPDYRQVMDAHGTHWQYKGEDVASVQVDADSKGAIMLDRSEVRERMRVGNYVWYNRGDRMSLRYEPEE